MALTNQERLDEAQAAYHSLVLGQGVAEIRDQNGETIRYNKANQSQLALYVSSLEALIAGTAPTGPMRIFS